MIINKLSAKQVSEFSYMNTHEDERTRWSSYIYPCKMGQVEIQRGRNGVRAAQYKKLVIVCSFLLAISLNIAPAFMDSFQMMTTLL